VDKTKPRILRDLWRVTKPYWTSEEKWSAWGLLLSVIGLNVGNVYISVRINEWNNSFYNALQAFNGKEFFHQIGVFCILAGLFIAISVYALYLSQMLRLRWRRWLTDRYLGAWLGNRAYYQLQLQNTTDNPDQRISEDPNLFTTYLVTLSIGMLTSIVTLVSFLVILWGLSGPAEIPLGHGIIFHIPAYLVWVALIYAGAGTWLTLKIGRPLVPLNFSQQQFEADFRFSLVRLRENAENVALYRGEPIELGVFRERFQNVFENFRQIMKRQKRLAWFTSGYTQVAIIFPIVAVAPRYFAKQLQLGGLMQVVNAFSSVQSSLSFIISSYTEIATLQAVTERLIGFEEHLSAINESVGRPYQIIVRRDGVGIAVQDLDLDLPNGTLLLEDVSFGLGKGEAMLITGPTGAGKSTLLRVIAGIWPFARGEIRIGKGVTFFLPQRPYLPLGSLARTLLYPYYQKSGGHTAALAEVLDEVGLGPLTSELDTVDNWSQRLSLGEQQRLAFARALLVKPDFLFLDEATSALDEASEVRLYHKMHTASWRPTLVSIGHRSTLRNLHDRIINIADFQPLRPQVPEMNGSVAVSMCGFASGEAATQDSPNVCRRD
jgi:putative ATP-binding cassette transporter